MNSADIQRIMAHEIEFEGKIYRNHILHLNRTDGKTELTPFRSELPFTIFVNGRIRAAITAHHSADGKLKYELCYEAY